MQDRVDQNSVALVFSGTGTLLRNTEASHPRKAEYTTSRNRHSSALKKVQGPGKFVSLLKKEEITVVKSQLSRFFTQAPLKENEAVTRK